MPPFGESPWGTEEECCTCGGAPWRPPAWQGMEAVQDPFVAQAELPLCWAQPQVHRFPPCPLLVNFRNSMIPNQALNRTIAPIMARMTSLVFPAFGLGWYASGTAPGGCSMGGTQRFLKNRADGLLALNLSGWAESNRFINCSRASHSSLTSSAGRTGDTTPGGKAVLAGDHNDRQADADGGSETKGQSHQRAIQERPMGITLWASIPFWAIARAILRQGIPAIGLHTSSREGNRKVNSVSPFAVRAALAAPPMPFTVSATLNNPKTSSVSVPA